MRTDPCHSYGQAGGFSNGLMMRFVRASPGHVQSPQTAQMHGYDGVQALCNHNLTATAPLTGLRVAHGWFSGSSTSSKSSRWLALQHMQCDVQSKEQASASSALVMPHALAPAAAWQKCTPKQSAGTVKHMCCLPTWRRNVGVLLVPAQTAAAQSPPAPDATDATGCMDDSCHGTQHLTSSRLHCMHA
jgi:hypothetical protein